MATQTQESTQRTGASETFLYILLGLIAACVIVASFADDLLDLLGAVFAFGCVPAMVIGLACLVIGHWSKRHDRQLARAERLAIIDAQVAQNEAIRAATRKNSGAITIAGDMVLPTSVLDRDDVVQALLVLAGQRIESQKTFAPVPHSLHWSVKNDNAASVPLLTDSQHKAVTVPSFGELWQSGQLPKDGFLLGYNLEDRAPVFADWRKLYSALIGGQSGSGKSTLIRNILAQSALQGGRFVVIDPHFDAGEESLGASLTPLRSKMLCDVASNEKQIVDALKYVGSVGQARLHGDGDRTPLILVCDETTGLLQRSGVADELEAVLGMISQETRKVGVFALCIGQQFKGDVMNTTVRNSFVSFLSCRARKDVARVMSGSNEFGKMASDLTIGQCVWMTPSGETLTLAVPNTTIHDLELVVGRDYTTSAPTSTPTSTDGDLDDCGSGCGSGAEVPTSNRNLTTSSTALDPRAQRVRSMLILGHSQNEIVKEVWGASGGRAYQQAADEFRLILSDLVK